MCYTEITVIKFEILYIVEENNLSSQIDLMKIC